MNSDMAASSEGNMDGWKEESFARCEVRLRSSSSVLAPQSAPSSPQADQLGPSSTNTPAVSIPPPRSPNHGFNNHERQTLKPLIVSAPVMTQAQSGGSLRTPQPTTADPLLTPGSDQGGPTSNKSRQKKFHRHFKQVEAEEHVLNYYSCALVGDILLQGHLYITKNYFAFYSNVFGYVTKLLIPTASVTKISKEKTARIIPNAIGVATEDEKHVFGSLLSRDSTYKFMIEVWKSACSSHPPDIMVPKPKILKKVVDAVTHSETNILDDDDDDDSSLSGSDHSGPPSQAESRTDISHSETCQSKVSISSLRKRTSHHFSAPKKPETLKESISHTNGLLLVSTILLVALFLSAAFLLYRISRIHDRFADNPLLTGSDDVYEEILKWQSQLHTRSASEVQEFLNTNLNQIVRVRQSLEALSSLIPSQEENSTPSGEQKTFIPNNNS